MVETFGFFREPWRTPGTTCLGCHNRSHLRQMEESYSAPASDGQLPSSSVSLSPVVKGASSRYLEFPWLYDPFKNGSMTQLFWVMTNHLWGHGDSR